MKPTKGTQPEDLERWENEGGSTPARRLHDERQSDPNVRRHVRQPGERMTPTGLWGMCSRLLDGMGRMFGFRQRPTP
jgi:hypothetical protein